MDSGVVTIVRYSARGTQGIKAPEDRVNPFFKGVAKLI